MKKYKFSTLTLYTILVAGSIVFSVFVLIRTGGLCLDTIVSGKGTDSFMDFFNHISYVRDPQNVYYASEHACFPPLIYCMYLLFAKMLPQDATVMYNAALTSSYAMLLYVAYCVVLAILLFYSIYKLAKRSIEWSLGMTVLIVMSNAFIFGVLERGNSALIVCIFLLRALELREREDRTARERALLLIAFSAGIKIYPAIFGLLYLIEKRWKEAGRLIVYGMLFFFAPFAFFGGSQGLMQFIRNQMIIQSDRVGTASVGAFWNLLTGMRNGEIAAVGYLILAVLGCVLARDMWKKIFLLSSIMVIAPLWSGRYTTIYMVIPLILYFRESRKGVINYVYTFLFACMFLLVAFSSTTVPEHLRVFCSPSAIERIAIYVMNIVLIAEAVIQHMRTNVNKPKRMGNKVK